MKSIINFLVLPVIFLGIISIANAQKPIGYLISFTYKTDGSLNPLADKVLFKSYGLFGSSHDSIGTDLHVYSGNLNYYDINNDLKSNPVLHNIIIVPLHDPITKAEKSQINGIFKKMRFNTEANSVKDWTIYFKSRLQNNFTYQLVFTKRFDLKKNIILLVKPTSQIPAYSHLKQFHSIPDTTYKSLDIGSDSTVYIRDTIVEVVEEKETPPPPPQPLPKNLKKMTDHQLKQWLIKQCLRKVKENQIQIKRSASEIVITIDFGDFRDTFSYSIK